MKEAADTANPRNGPRPWGASALRRVLAVDDEADLRGLLELTLVGMGLGVDCVGSISEA